jgi:hypothetical protein
MPVTDRYLDTLLLAALSQPGAATSPAAGRAIAGLLTLAAADGNGGIMAPYLAAIPSRPTVFEVHRYGPGDTVPTVVASNLDAIEAVREALHPVPPDSAGIEVIGRDTGGVERCVLVKATKGELEFLFPERDAFDGPEAACSDAHRQWTQALSAWATRSAPESRAVNVGQEVIDAVRSSLAEMTVEVDLQEVEEIIRRSVATGPPVATPRDVAKVLSRLVPTSAEIAEQVTEKVAPLLAKSGSTVSTGSTGSTGSAGSSGSSGSSGSMAGTSDRRLVSALLEAMERLAVDVHDVRDHVRRSGGQLDALEARVAAGGRFDEGIEQLRASLAIDLERVSKRLEEEIKDTVTNGQPFPTGEEIASLSRRLRRSGVYLDRLLQRLNELVDHESLEAGFSNGAVTNGIGEDHGEDDGDSVSATAPFDASHRAGPNS